MQLLERLIETSAEVGILCLITGGFGALSYWVSKPSRFNPDFSQWWKKRKRKGSQDSPLTACGMGDPFEEMDTVNSQSDCRPIKQTPSAESEPQAQQINEASKESMGTGPVASPLQVSNDSESNRSSNRNITQSGPDRGRWYKRSAAIAVPTLLALIVLSGWLLPNLPTSAKASNSDIEAIAKTMSFCIAREIMADELSNRYPSLRARLQAAESRFEAKFGASIDNMEDILMRDYPEWPSMKESIRKQVLVQAQAEGLDFNNIDPEAVAQNIEKQANGAQIPVPYLVTMLKFRPRSP